MLLFVGVEDSLVQILIKLIKAETLSAVLPNCGVFCYVLSFLAQFFFRRGIISNIV